MINFLQIRTFVAVVEAGGFIAAETSLHRSQPSITSSIKKLETTLGYKLFDRSHYRPELTAKGKIFYHKAQVLLRQVSEFEDTLTDFSSDFLEPEFIIDIDNAVDITTYMPMIRSLIKTFPDTYFSLKTHTEMECIQRLKKNESNICIIAKTWSRDNKGIGVGINQPMENIDYLPLSYLRFIWVASPNYIKPGTPFQLQHTVSISIINNEHQEPKPQGETFIGVAPPGMLVNDRLTQKLLVLSGIGVGFMPEELVKEELADGRLINLSLYLDENSNFNNCPSTSVPSYAMRLKNQDKGIIAIHAWELLSQIS